MRYIIVEAAFRSRGRELQQICQNHRNDLDEDLIALTLAAPKPRTVVKKLPEGTKGRKLIQHGSRLQWLVVQKSVR